MRGKLLDLVVSCGLELFIVVKKFPPFLALLIMTMFSHIAIGAPLPQTYQVPLGDTFVSIESPMGAEKQSLRIVNGHAWANWARGEEASLAKNYANSNIRYQRRFGSEVAALVLAGDASVDSVIGEFSDFNSPRVSAGLTSHVNSGFGASFRVGSVLPIMGSPAVADGDMTVGLFRASYGVAFSGGVVLPPAGGVEYKAKGGAYIGKRNFSLSLEAVQRFGQFKPAEVFVGGLYKRKKLIIYPALGIGLNDQDGTPKYRVLLSFSYRPQKKAKEDEGEEEEVEDPNEEGLIDEPTTEEIEGEKIVVKDPITEGATNKDELKPAVDKTTSGKSKDVQKNKNSNVVSSYQSTTSTHQSKTNNSPREKTINNEGGQNMPTGEITNTYQSADPTGAALAGELGNLAQSTGGDSMLAIVLALIAVVGGGAAWKFYRQYSEQKHERSMAQMKMNAQAQGMTGAQPPPCQVANAKLDAEIKQLKSRLNTIDNKMSLNADFDGDFVERKVKKLERRLEELEEAQS
jgi:hypothetical protein